MKILFILKQSGYIRHFDTVVHELATRGHAVRLVAQDGETFLPPLIAGDPGVSVIDGPKKRGDEWRASVTLIRRAADYLRYVEPPFTAASKLRARAFEKLLLSLGSDESAAPAWADIAFALGESERQTLRKTLALIEEQIPADPAMVEFMRREAPDVVLITPLIDIGSAQTDFVKAARVLGIPSVMALFSWDNLTTKGIVHDWPDRVLVWNELQVREATELHGLPADRVSVTGAPRFDAFFALQPTVERQVFCEAFGFDASAPIVCYLGSSKFVSEDEGAFISTWIDAVRSQPELAGCNILIKPHPDLNKRWAVSSEEHAKWEGVGSVTVSRPYATPRVAVARSKFTAAQFLYECLHHSAAVVGLNTSAEIEAGILGKPVLTIALEGAIADGQVGTLHFHYLLEREGGFVREASDLDTHVRQLVDAVAGRSDAGRIQRFIKAFIRPHGLEKEASGVFVDAVEQAAESGRRADPFGPVEDAAAKKKSWKDTKAGVNRREVSAAGNGMEQVLLDYPPEPIWLVASSDMEKKWRAKACAKEPFTVEWIERHIREGDVFYDIGANVGAFSLIAAKRCRNKATVVAFEPGYASFAHLCDNIVLNGCDTSIIPVPLPLSGSTRLASFKYRTLHPGQSRHALGDTPAGKPRDKGEERYRQPVFAIRLDDLVTQFGLPAPTHVKLDVDGGELQVIEGGVRTFGGGSVRTMLIEIDQSLTDEVTERLRRLGFRLDQRYQRESKKAEAPWYGLFVRA